MKKLVYRMTATLLSAIVFLSGMSIRAFAEEVNIEGIEAVELDEITGSKEALESESDADEVVWNSEESSEELKIRGEYTEIDESELGVEITEGTEKEEICDELDATEISETEEAAEELVVTELQTQAGNQAVTATGAMPVGAELMAEEITYVEVAEDAVNDVVSDYMRFSVVKAFDIRILVDGEDWQPVEDNTTVRISISDIKGCDEGNDIKVFRIEDDDQGVTDMCAEFDGDTVSFDTEHFTVYAVGSAKYDTADADHEWDLSADGDGSIMAYWYEDDEQLIITGSGEMTYIFDDIHEMLSDRSFNVSWVDADGISSIANNLLWGCTQMTMNSLPAGLTDIGDYAFCDCESITLSSLPEGISTIGAQSFYRCLGLELSEFPRGVRSIGLEAFRQCVNLRADIVLTELSELGYSAFEESGIKSVDLTGSDELTSIGTAAFETCKELEKVVLPANITTIELNAISECPVLSSIDLSGLTKLETIEKYAFSWDEGLKEVRLPAGIKKIGHGAFAYSGLTSLDMSGCGNITEIFWGTFENCPLTELFLPSDITKIGNSAFRGAMLPELDLSEYRNLTTIGQFAFGDCTELKRLVLPDSLTSLNELCAFYGCNSLTEIIGGDNIESIDKSTFAVTGLSAMYFFDTESEYDEESTDWMSVCANITKSPYDGDQVYLSTSIDTESEAIKNYDWEFACRQIGKVITIDGIDYDVTDAEAYDLSYSQDKSILAYYFIQDDEPYIIVSGIGLMKDFAPSTYAGRELSPLKEIKEYTLLWDDHGIRSIGDCVFKNYDYYGTDEDRQIRGSITSLPDGLEKIGQQAFYYTGISAEIPEGIREIGNSAFQGCPNLTIDHLPESLRSIGANALSYCTGITDITIHEGLYSSFYGYGYLEDGLFMGCSNLRTVTLPYDISVIGSRAFLSCVNLESCNLPERVSAIAKSAFAGCEKLQMDELPENLTQIADMGFIGCSSLKISKLPDSLERIGDSAFSSSGVTISKLPASLIKLGESAFWGCDGMTEIDFSSATGLMELSDSVFKNCKGITKANLGSNLTSIGNEAFYGCTSLKDIIADGNAVIGNSVFGIESNIAGAMHGSEDIGTYSEKSESSEGYALPLKTTLNGSADWFETYDFKADNRLIGGYTVTLPMSVELTYHEKDGLGSIGFGVSNNTNGWRLQVIENIKEEFISEAGEVLPISIAYGSISRSYGPGNTDERLKLKVGAVPVHEGAYKGVITFTTSIIG